jgi:serine/threonine protein kinase/WD40 repeat protein
VNELKRSEETLFEALSQLPAVQRDASLEEACGSDSAMRERLEILLAAHDRASGFMAESVAPPLPGNSGLRIPVAERLGDQIGPYKLIQQIGEGGCGVVYMAQQDKPVRRLVALKIIKLGMDTRQVVARFEAERQALALMDHPNIAKVLDAGATETGRPYFVMELVRGVKITEYCDQNELATAQRLELFVQVCRGVQHAHQKGIIHRDLKPSNILVTANDGVPVPKVIDFGIAKATQGRLTDQTLVTAFDQFIGTPAYVSPEQALMTIVDIDTRSDIYSLGVLLYELLTGTTPFDTKQLLAAGLDEMRRTICEKQPDRPSTRNRQSSAGALAHSPLASRHSSLPTDLDWIVMKCLEKERARRYETASGLARDIEHHLHNEPVTARPPSRLYEFERSVRRHWVGFAAVTAVLAVLAVGVVVSTFEAVRARHAEQSALNSKANEATARTLAEQRLYDAKLAQARARRRTGTAGQGFESLAAISEAAAIHRSQELTDEAVAALSLTDLRVQKTYQFDSRKVAEHIMFDERLEHYACETTNGISIRRAADNQEVKFLPLKAPIDLPSMVICWMQFVASNHFFRAQIVHANGQNWCLWDLSKGDALVRDLSADFLALGPEGKTLVIARDGTLSFQDLDSGQELRRIKAIVRVDTLHFSHGGDWIAGFKQSDPRLQIWEVASGQILVNVLNSDDICSAAWNHDDTLLAVGGRNGEINLWDVQRGELLRRLEGHRDRICGLVFDHRGRMLASTSWDGTARLWNIPTGQPLVVYPGMLAAEVFSLDDQTLACAFAGPECYLLQVAPPLGYRRLVSRESLGGSASLDLSPDGRLAAVGTEKGIRLVDIPAAHELGVVGRGYYRSLCFDSGATQSLWASGAKGLQRWPMRFGTQHGQPVVRVGPLECVLSHLWTRTFTSDRNFGRFAISRYQDGADIDGIVLWDRCHPTTPPKFCLERNSFLTMDPAGQWVASGTWNGAGVRIWDFETGQILRELLVRGSAEVACSPDGNWLATDNETEYRLWDTKSWAPTPQCLPADSTWATGTMAFSPDGFLLATCHDIRQIQIVSVPSLQVVARLVVPSAEKFKLLRFSSDGATLAALEDSGTIHLWDLRQIRAQLKKLSLDWRIPDLAPSGELPSTGLTALVLDAGAFSREELRDTIPARSANAPANLIDLTEYYNAPLTTNWCNTQQAHDDLSTLPRGVQTLAGVDFDIRGLIQIGSGATHALAYPLQVRNIRIGQTCHRLHFLQAALGPVRGRDGDRLGSYVIHYVDGREVDIPIVVGQSVADWWSQPDEENMKFTIAWTGDNPVARRSGRTIHLFKSTWENPYPAVRIRQFDFISDEGSAGAPFLVALTAEP